MTTDNAHRWLALGANVGVLLGLILLIAELNQNSKLVRIEIEQSRSATYVAWLRDAALNDHYPALVANFGSMGGSFEERFAQRNPVERQRIRLVTEARFYDYENLFSQYQEGFVGDEYWEQRIVSAVRVWARRWAVTHPPNGPTGRQAFHDEVSRILRESP